MTPRFHLTRATHYAECIAGCFIAFGLMAHHLAIAAQREAANDRGDGPKVA